jgi:hypothetical protein
MKNYADTLKTFFVSAMVFVLAGCSNLFINKQAEPDREIPEGKGVVRWSVETQTARTLFPDLPFDQYDLTFTMPGKTTVTETFATHTGELTLETGRWEVSVSASIGDDPIAQGSAQLVVLGGQTNSVTVTLRGITVSGTGTGTLDYNVVLPAGLLYGELSVASLDSGGYASNIPLTVPSGSITLPDGYYVLAFSFFRTTQRAVITDVAHIYDGLITNGVYDFSAAPFADAPEIAVPAGGAVFYVNSAAELAAIAGDIGNTAKNSGKNAYILNSDINLSVYSPWTPLGSDTTPFEGYLFGDGHAIGGLNPGASGENIGFFGVVNNARIENMGVEIADTHITLPVGNQETNVGIIAGSGRGNTIFKDLWISVAPGGEFAVGGDTDYLNVGGIVGKFLATMERCSFVGNITVTGEAEASFAGGLAARGGLTEQEQGNISQSYMVGTITHTNTFLSASVFTGGLVAYGNIENCYHNGDIFASGAMALTGGINADPTGGVSRSYAAGSIAGSGSAGHTAGITAGNAHGLNNSAALNLAISGPSSVRIGGDSNRTNNYTLSTMLVNGLVIADAAVDPQDDVNGLGKTAAELKTRSTYETGLGWDFTDVWEMGPANYPYPILKWQKGQVDLPDGYGLIKFPEDFAMAFTALNDLSDYLESLRQNSAMEPYHVKLSGLNISDFADTSSDALGELFAALMGRYVKLDLSDCSGTAVADTPYARIDARPNKTMLVSITLPGSLTSIGVNAFLQCSSLASVGFPSGLPSISIDSSAFYGCSSLASIEFPTGLTSISIGSTAFLQCSSLVSVEFPSGLTSVSIGGRAFESCTSLASIALPSGLTSIESSVFEMCYSLVSVELPAGLISIGSRAFEHCHSLASITLPAGLTTIGERAFLSCVMITSIELPADLIVIRGSAFYNCGALLVICRAVSPPYLIPAASYYGSSFNAAQTIQVPASSVNDYKTASGWSDYVNIITAIP